MSLGRWAPLTLPASTVCTSLGAHVRSMLKLCGPMRASPHACLHQLPIQADGLSACPAPPACHAHSLVRGSQCAGLLSCTLSPLPFIPRSGRYHHLLTVHQPSAWLLLLLLLQ